MGFRLEKLDKGKSNNDSRYRLVNIEDGIDVIITYKSFREVLERLGFSSHRIGYIVKLINKLYPLDFKHLRIPIEEKISDNELIAFLKFYGFTVRKIEEKVSLSEAIRILEQRGYKVSGLKHGLPYSTPVVCKN